MLMTLFCNGAALSGCTQFDVTLIFVIAIPLLFLAIWMLEK
jgi:hypothetical protein